MVMMEGGNPRRRKGTEAGREKFGVGTSVFGTISSLNNHNNNKINNFKKNNGFKFSTCG